MATAACFCCPSLEGFPISGGAAGAATGCCSFRFANEKLGQVSRKLLKDMFSNLALPAWARYSALTGSPALSQEPGMSLHGAGGDKEGGPWGQHTGYRSGCPTWRVSHITGVMLCLKEGEKYQTPKSQAKTHDLSLLELMGDSHLLLPQEIAQIFFGNFQCPVLPLGILAVAAHQPGWRNAEGLQPDVHCTADPWGGRRAWCWLSPSWTVVSCPACQGVVILLCCQHPFADACGEWRW